jgi:hypothetical protein
MAPMTDFLLYSFELRLGVHSGIGLVHKCEPIIFYFRRFQMRSLHELMDGVDDTLS